MSVRTAYINTLSPYQNVKHVLCAHVISVYFTHVTNDALNTSYKHSTTM